MLQSLAMAKTPAPETSEPRFDEVLSRLRTIVERLEGGNLALEDSLRLFEEGMNLCRQGAAVLDKAEKRVEVLLATADGGTTVASLDQPEPDEDSK